MNSHISNLDIFFLSEILSYSVSSRSKLLSSSNYSVFDIIRIITVRFSTPFFQLRDFSSLSIFLSQLPDPSFTDVKIF